LWLSSRGYGCLLHRPERAVVDCGAFSSVTLGFAVAAPEMDYFVFLGDPRTIIERYTALTGRPALPPRWAFGIWMSRCMYRNRAEVEAVVEWMRARDLPLDVIHVDPLWLRGRAARVLDACDFVWDEEAFPDPRGFVVGLRARGVPLPPGDNPYVPRHGGAAAGSQRYPAHWSGAAQATFGGMAGALRAGLGFACAGGAFWGHDIGGFWGPDAFAPPSPRLYVRWAQFGLLSPIARFHGTTPREPWEFGDEAVAIVRAFSRLRYRLLPYLEACARGAATAEIRVPDRDVTMEARVVAHGTHLVLDLAPTTRTVALRLCGRAGGSHVHVDEGAATCRRAADERGEVLAVAAPRGARLRLVSPRVAGV